MMHEEARRIQRLVGLLNNYKFGYTIQFCKDGTWHDYDYTLEQILHDFMLEQRTGKERIRVK